MIKVIFFDLDGTLLPMDQEVFVKAYMSKLVEKLAAEGYNADKLVAGMGAGIKAMIKNDGTATNEAVFWKAFSNAAGEEILKEKEVINDFYKNEFQSVADICGYNPLAKQAIMRIKEKGYRMILATNPLFPALATESRIRWAGLEPSDFELYTTYEDNRFCKPNLDYYRELIKQVGVEPEECLMVGNDVEDDMVTKELGMQVFLLSDCLINKKEKDVSGYPQGSLEDLLAFVGA